jgi:hypothetical protein
MLCHRGRSTLAPIAVPAIHAPSRARRATPRRHARAWHWLAVGYQQLGLPGDFLYASGMSQALDHGRAGEPGPRIAQEQP